MRATAGVIALAERVRLDAAAAFRVTRESPDVVLTFGITIVLNPR